MDMTNYTTEQLRDVINACCITSAEHTHCNNFHGSCIMDADKCVRCVSDACTAKAALAAQKGGVA